MLAPGQLKWLKGCGVDDVKLVNLSWAKLVAPNKKGARRRVLVAGVCGRRWFALVIGKQALGLVCSGSAPVFGSKQRRGAAEDEPGRTQTAC